MPLEAINDFVIRFANVNGSGSASANEMFARAIMRMGVPVAPRNVFPSNIQGLPTWYEIRVNEKGHLGARGGTDFMIAMNPQTFNADVASIEPDGYLLYDSTRALPPGKMRTDINVIGVPLTAICNKEYTDPRQRQLFKNIICLGVLIELFGMDFAEVEKLISEQYRGKDKLIPPNVHALHMGKDWARANLKPIGLRIRRSTGVGDRILLEGNYAAALGAVYGGATVCAWYPITPSSSLAEAFTNHCKKFRHDPETGKARYAIVQAEDELASIGMVVGAGWNGARAFTATSGPGISLMQEFLGFAYFAEIPAVVMDVQRAGPSTGMPTRTQQCDITVCAYASHGDTKHVLLLPEDPAEAFDFAAQCLRRRRPPADAGVPDARPRHRHEPPAVPAAEVGQHPQIRSRQGAVGRRPRESQGFRALHGCRQGRHPLPHLPRHASAEGRVLHPRHFARQPRALFRAGPGLCRGHAAPAAQARDRQGVPAASAAHGRAEGDALRRDLLRLDLARR